MYVLYRISTKGSGKARFCTKYIHQACDGLHCKLAIPVLLRTMKVRDVRSSCTVVFDGHVVYDAELLCTVVFHNVSAQLWRKHSERGGSTS